MALLQGEAGREVRAVKLHQEVQGRAWRRLQAPLRMVAVAGEGAEEALRPVRLSPLLAGLTAGLVWGHFLDKRACGTGVVRLPTPALPTSLGRWRCLSTGATTTWSPIPGVNRPAGRGSS